MMSNSHEKEKQLRNSLIAGSVSGMVTKTLVAPIDRIKILYQVSGDPFNLRKGMRTIGRILQQKGIKGMWRGNSASLLRVIPYAAIQFTTHEQLKQLFEIRTYEQKLNHPALCFIAGGFAGLTALSCTYPFDVARARMATDDSYRSVFDVMKRAFMSKDVKFGLYRGYGPAVISIVPYTGVSFFVYELFKTRYFAQKEQLNSHDRFSLAIQNILLGMIVSFVGQTLIYPLEIVRRRMQTDANADPRFGPLFLDLFRKNGIRGFYNGITLSWTKLPIVIGCSMTTFDLVYSMLNKYWV